MRRNWAILLGILWLALMMGCGSKPPAEESAGNAPAPNEPGTTTSRGSSKAPSMLDKLTKKTITVPEGSVLEVRLNDTLSSKDSQAGQSFSAVVDEPLMVENKVAIPKGADATGTVVDAKPLGRFKGGASLQIELTSVSFGGSSYNLQTASVNRAAKGKGKRTAVMIGGGAGVGALIGGLAGGGKGAAIGALVGAGAGTAGAAFTGNKNIVLPAETLLSFKLLKAIEVKEQ